LFRSTEFEEWRDNLLGVVQSMPAASFEKLCQRVLRESGFTRVEVTGRSGDGGVDGIGVLRIALLSFHVFFQCKRYKGAVGAGAIRDFRGAMVGRTDKGLFITTGSFTPDAKKEATRDGAPVLDLIDGEALSKILKDLNLGVSTRQVEEVSIDPEWFETV
jgi:restriction system protein